MSKKSEEQKRSKKDMFESKDFCKATADYMKSQRFNNMLKSANDKLQTVTSCNRLTSDFAKKKANERATERFNWKFKKEMNSIADQFGEKVKPLNDDLNQCLLNYGNDSNDNTNNECIRTYEYNFQQMWTDELLKKAEDWCALQLQNESGSSTSSSNQKTNYQATSSLSSPGYGGSSSSGSSSKAQSKSLTQSQKPQSQSKPKQQLSDQYQDQNQNSYDSSFKEKVDGGIYSSQFKTNDRFSDENEEMFSKSMFKDEDNYSLRGGMEYDTNIEDQYKEFGKPFDGSDNFYKEHEQYGQYFNDEDKYK